MGKLFKTLMLITILSVVQFFFLEDFYIKSSLVSDIITFLSIIFGFYITSLAIFSTSSYVSSLYNIVDKENKNNTLLHTLLNNYKFGLISILVSIFYFIMIEFALNQNIGQKISMSNILSLPFFGIIVNNVAYSYIMISDLSNIIIQEMKRKAN